MIGFQSSTVADCLVARRIPINAAICNLCLICACRRPFTAVQEWIDCMLLNTLCVPKVILVSLLACWKAQLQHISIDQDHIRPGSNLRVAQHTLIWYMAKYVNYIYRFYIHVCLTQLVNMEYINDHHIQWLLLLFFITLVCICLIFCHINKDYLYVL